MDGLMDGLVMGGKTDKRKKGLIDGWSTGWVERWIRDVCMDGWIDGGGMEGLIIRGLDRETDEKVDEWKGDEMNRWVE